MFFQLHFLTKCNDNISLKIPDVRGIANRKHVEEGYDQVQQALLEYTLTCYPHIQVSKSSIKPIKKNKEFFPNFNK